MNLKDKFNLRIYLICKKIGCQIITKFILSEYNFWKLLIFTIKIKYLNITLNLLYAGSIEFHR